MAVGPYPVSRGDRRRVARQSSAARRGARRPGGRPGAAVHGVPRDPESAGSGGDPEGSPPLCAARSRRSRLCRVLRARRCRHQQQHAAAMGSGDDRARRRVPKERRHPGSCGAHVVRPTEPSRGRDEAARGVPSVLRADADGEAHAAGLTVKFTFRDLIRRADREADGYSRALQAARVRAAYQRSYFAPALFSLIPITTDLIDSMAVDAHWRLYYNDTWVARHTVEENATLLIHEVGHLLRDHASRRKAAGITDHRRWNTAADCEINDDLHAEGLPLPGDPPLPARYGLESGATAEFYYKQLPGPGTTRTRASAASEPRERPA